MILLKEYFLSPTNTKRLVNSYFNIFLTLKSSSQRAQNKIATNQQNYVAFEAINKIIFFFKHDTEEERKILSSVFFK